MNKKKYLFAETDEVLNAGCMRSIVKITSGQYIPFAKGGPNTCMRQ